MPVSRRAAVVFLPFSAAPCTTSAFADDDVPSGTIEFVAPFVPGQ